MVVSMTTTVNRSFGAKLVTPNSGLVLNDELDDFNKPSDFKRLGLLDGPNLPRPGARPTSSMTPTIVLRGGKPVLAIGGSGGMLISTNVTQLLLGRLVFERTPRELVNDPRFYIGMRDATTLLLDPGSAPALTADLTRRGEVVQPMPYLTSGVQLVAGELGALEAAADPRKQGSAQALP
jgi:gamma-glutamyltranspeptidase/glutathione hydrolase